MQPIYHIPSGVMLLLLLLIFVLGIVTGSTLTIGLAPHFAHVPGAAQMKNHWMMRLVQRLKLTADQQAKIQPILTDAETKIQALQRDEVEHGSQIIKAANDQISAVLTPDQKAELESVESQPLASCSLAHLPSGNRQ